MPSDLPFSNVIVSNTAPPPRQEGGFTPAGTTELYGITYSLLSRKIETRIPGIFIKLEAYIPPLTGSKFFFTISATVEKDPSYKLNHTPREENLVGSNFMIEYYNIESADEDPIKSRRFDESMIPPLGVGCNKLKKNLYPSFRMVQSISMDYMQRSTGMRNLLAYNAVSNLLRKERVGDSISIWDLGENLLYHQDRSPVTGVTGCSILDTSDEHLGDYFLPVKGSKAFPLEHLLGARSLSFMGKGLSRGVPCLIYEATLEKPPRFFGLPAYDLDLESSDKIEYQIVFWLIAGDHLTDQDLEIEFPDMEFVPLSIELIKHDKSIGKYESLEVLEVYDLHWSIYGWDIRPTEIFMIPSCFTNKDQQVRVQFAVNYHHSGSESQTKEDVQLMVDNRYKLESDIIAQILLASNISPISIVHSELLIRPNHIAVDLLLGGRDQIVKLTYDGQGEIDNPGYYKYRHEFMEGLTEDECVLRSSLVDQINMVVYCPDEESTSKCHAIHHEQEPTYKKIINTDPHAKLCQVYKFKPQTNQVHIVDQMDVLNKVLKHRPIFFYLFAPDSRKEEKLELYGNVRDFDVTQEVHLQTVKKYSFVSSSPENDLGDAELGGQVPLVRSFSSILQIRSETSCEDLCNLDIHCKSYSYCSSSDTNSASCYLAQLDLRRANIFEQLASSTVSLTNQVTIHDGPQEYQIIFASNCVMKEKNFLSIYRDTHESIFLLEHLVAQFPTVASNSECARQSSSLEASAPSEHISMFAYCPKLRTCILDETLLTSSGPPKDNLQTTVMSDEDRFVDDLADDDKRVSRPEVSCRIYRKKYETYFEVSHEILADAEPHEQVSYELDSVEKCARACWMNFGPGCASFDFCSAGRCLINRVSLRDLPKSRRKSVPKCLHYERNQVYDELQRKGLQARHKLLLPAGDDPLVYAPTSSALLSLLIYIITGCGFIFGLALGVRVSEKADRVTILRQSLSAGAGLRASTLPDFRGFAPPGNSNRGFSYQDDHSDDSNGLEDANAIQLTQINKEHEGEIE